MMEVTPPSERAMPARKAVTKEKPPARHAPRTPVSDERQLEQWFVQFDAKLADLSARQDALLRSLGVEPVRSSRSAESV
jgi:hypothetical protein